MRSAMGAYVGAKDPKTEPANPCAAFSDGRTAKGIPKAYTLNAVGDCWSCQVKEALRADRFDAASALAALKNFAAPGLPYPDEARVFVVQAPQISRVWKPWRSHKRLSPGPGKQKSDAVRRPAAQLAAGRKQSSQKPPQQRSPAKLLPRRRQESGRSCWTRGTTRRVADPAPFRRRRGEKPRSET